jgi:hypothetical protein
MLAITTVVQMRLVTVALLQSRLHVCYGIIMGVLNEKLACQLPKNGDVQRGNSL